MTRKEQIPRREARLIVAIRRVFKQIRALMSEDIRLEGSSVEMDEMYFGGKEKNKHVWKRKTYGYGSDGKTTVFGMVQRGGRVVAKVTPNAEEKTLYPIIEGFVLSRASFTPMISWSTTACVSIATGIAASITRKRCLSWATSTPTRLRDSGA